jgi:hypothetical protein
MYADIQLKNYNCSRINSLQYHAVRDIFTVFLICSHFLFPFASSLFSVALLFASVVIWMNHEVSLCSRFVRFPLSTFFKPCTVFNKVVVP